MIEPHYAVSCVMVALGGVFTIAGARRSSWLKDLTLVKRLADRWGEATAMGLMLLIGIALIIGGIYVATRGPVTLA